MQVRFLPVEAADRAAVERLSALASAIVKQHYDPLLGPEQNDYMIRRFQSTPALTEQLRQGVAYRVVLADDAPAGFLAYYPRRDEGRDKLYLSKFYLAQAYRGRGLGRRMMDYVRQQAAARGLGTVFLNVNRYNADSIAVYRRLGFRVIREEKIDIGEGFFMDDFVMEGAV